MDAFVQGEEQARVVATHAQVAELVRRMARVPGESRLEEADRLEAAIEYLDGEETALVARLVEDDALSEETIREIKEIIDTRFEG